MRVLRHFCPETPVDIARHAFDLALKRLPGMPCVLYPCALPHSSPQYVLSIANHSHLRYYFHMIICVCNNVNETAIRRAVADGHASYDALQFELGVGTCCGQCQHAAREVIAQCHGAQHRTVRERLENTLRPALQTIRIQPA
jgi:bacterioferritin-associated ferredoxin